MMGFLKVLGPETKTHSVKTSVFTSALQCLTYVAYMCRQIDG